MTTVDSTTKSSSVLAALNSSSSASSTSSTTAEDIQNRFLTLLVAQLENQDPLNPLDNTEITSQLSQMSTVQGIEQLNTTLSSLVDSLADTQAVQASALIGNTVLVPGSHLTLSEGAAYGGVNLASAADQVTVSILDSTGKVVQTQTLGANEAGNVLFSWDGSTSSETTATDGSYTFKVTATKGTASVTAEALQLGTVSALTRNTSGDFVLDLGSLGKFDFDDVQQVL
jgi:flagellar basal-body rod modification protein FlgD